MQGFNKSRTCSKKKMRYSLELRVAKSWFQTKQRAWYILYSFGIQMKSELRPWVPLHVYLHLRTCTKVLLLIFKIEKFVLYCRPIPASFVVLMLDNPPTQPKKLLGWTEISVLWPCTALIFWIQICGAILQDSLSIQLSLHYISAITITNSTANHYAVQPPYGRLHVRHTKNNKTVSASSELKRVALRYARSHSIVQHRHISLNNSPNNKMITHSGHHTKYRVLSFGHTMLVDITGSGPAFVRHYQ